MNKPYLEKYPTESTTFEIDCSDQLASGETIVGAPQMSAEPVLSGADAITFGTPIVNPSPVVYSSTQTIPAGKLIQVRIGGGSVPNGMRHRSYSVLATFQTSDGNTAVAKATLKVLSTKPEVSL